MLVADAFIKTLDGYNWDRAMLYSYDHYDYDFWTLVAINVFGEYQGDKDFYKLEEYCEAARQKITAKIMALGGAEPDEELRLLVTDARIARLLQDALDPQRTGSIKGFVDEYIEPSYKNQYEEQSDQKARDLISTPDGIDYCSLKLGDAISISISKLINNNIDTYTFSSYLFKLINESRYSEPEIYKMAGLNRQQFSKMKKSTYQPTKPTVFALIIAMHLDMEAAEKLLKYAGFTFSPASQLDRTIEFFVREKIYSLDLVNYVLYKNDIPVLGSKTRE